MSSIPVANERWIAVTYRVRSTADAIDARAEAIALEQSIEGPLAAVADARVLAEVVAQVAEVKAIASDVFDVSIRLAAETTGFEAGQLLNMLFGNTSLHDDVALTDADFSTSFVAHFGGPRFGIPGIRKLTGAHGRPLTCSAVKQQGVAAPHRSARPPPVCGVEAAGVAARRPREACGHACARGDRHRQGRPRPREPIIGAF